MPTKTKTKTDNYARDQAAAKYRSICEMLSELEAAEGCEHEAHQRIQEHPLEILVRSDWANLGEPLDAGEFSILLCTGGPAVRIVGDLDWRGEPCRARLEYQDSDTGWTQWTEADSDILCEYAAHFFGD
jgi:hypothetical protein